MASLRDRLGNLPIGVPVHSHECPNRVVKRGRVSQERARVFEDHVDGGAVGHGQRVRGSLQCGDVLMDLGEGVLAALIATSEHVFEKIRERPARSVASGPGWRDRPPPGQPASPARPGQPALRSASRRIVASSNLTTIKAHRAPEIYLVSRCTRWRSESAAAECVRSLLSTIGEVNKVR